MNNDTPELRFNNFTNDPIKYKLSEITKRIKSYSLSRNVETKEDTGYKYIHYGDIHKKVANIIDRESRLPNIKPGNYELLKRGDLVIADASEDYQGIAAPSIVNDNLTYNIVAGLHTIALRPIKADSLYLYYLFNSQKFRKYGYKVGTGMKVFGISVSNLVQFESYIPSISEQVEVGILLKKVDQTIKLQQQLLNDHKQLKKAMLQKMFPQKGESVPRVRFAGFVGKWNKDKIENLLIERKERSGEGELISVTTNFGVVKATDLNRTDNSSKDKSNYKKVEKGDIAYNSMRMWQGASGLSKYTGIVSPAYTIIIPKEAVSPLFISYLFKLPSMIQTFQTNSQGLTSDTWNLKYPMLKNIKIKLPELKEQEKIGNFFNQLDETIDLHQKKLETYQEFKKAMLQKMFV